MLKRDKYLNKIILGDNIEILEKLPAKLVDLIFAYPPYLKNERSKSSKK